MEFYSAPQWTCCFMHIINDLFHLLCISILSTDSMNYPCLHDPAWGHISAEVDCAQIFEPNILLFSPADIEFHHSYLQRLIPDTRPLYMIAAREQIISFTKQVIGWHLKAWNSDACLKNALSCEPSGMYCWCALFPQISFHPRLPISPSAGNPVSSDFLLLTDLRNEDGDPNVPLRHILINLD